MHAAVTRLGLFCEDQHAKGTKQNENYRFHGAWYASELIRVYELVNVAIVSGPDILKLPANIHSSEELNKVNVVLPAGELNGV